MSVTLPLFCLPVFLLLLLLLFPRHAFDGHQRIVVVEAHDPDALGVAADDAHVAGGDALDLAVGGHHQQFVLVGDGHDADHLAVALGGLDVAQPLAAAALRAVTALRVSVFGLFVGFGLFGFRGH